MEFTRAISKRSLHFPLICQICGDIARGMNFDVLTCMSCKAFFRRHALKYEKHFHCILDNNCNITKQTRTGCSACRLKKCFSLGMNPKLIRSPCKNKRIKQQIIKTSLSEPKPLSLLNNDRSLLTIAEWNILSNIIHAYEEQNLVVRTQYCFKEQLSLPPKIRSKTTNTIELIGLYYTAIQPFIESSPYFYNLSTDLRRIIIQNNFNGIGSFNSVIAAVEANVFDNEVHLLACNEIYGADYVKEIQRFISRIEPNRTLLKTILMILAFSTNCSIVTYDRSINFMNVSSFYSCYLIQIQNIFITMLWKYLIYQYGYVDAIRTYARLVKSYLDILNRMSENVSKQHWKMVDTIVEETMHLLTIDD